MKGHSLPLALAGIVFTLGAADAAWSQGLSLGARIGTPGIGIEATRSLTHNVNLRSNFNFGSLSRSTNINLSGGDVGADVDFKAKLRLRSLTALLDLHPGGGGFHLTGGLVLNRNKLTMDAGVVGTITINDQVYSVTEVAGLVAEGELGRRWVPYAGLGFGNAVGANKRVTFLFDLGVYFQGQPKLALIARGLAAGTPGLQEDLDQAAADINHDDLNHGYLRYYPVVSFGLAFKVL
jgi:hypothetical protein